MASADFAKQIVAAGLSASGRRPSARKTAPRSGAVTAGTLHDLLVGLTRRLREEHAAEIGRLEKRIAELERQAGKG